MQYLIRMLSITTVIETLKYGVSKFKKIKVKKVIKNGFVYLFDNSKYILLIRLYTNCYVVALILIKAKIHSKHLFVYMCASCQNGRHIVEVIYDPI